MSIEPCAVIKSGLVTNIVLADATTYAAAGATIAAIGNSGAGIDWLYANGAFTPPLAKPLTPDALLAYASAARDVRINAGITVNTAPSGSAPNNFSVDTDATGRVNLLGLEALMDKGQSVVWQQSTGAVILTAGQLNALAVSAGLYVQQCYQEYGSIVAGISASPPTITTTATIDSAAWPASTISAPVAPGA